MTTLDQLDLVKAMAKRIEGRRHAMGMRGMLDSEYDEVFNIAYFAIIGRRPSARRIILSEKRDLIRLRSVIKGYAK